MCNYLFLLRIQTNPCISIYWIRVFLHDCVRWCFGFFITNVCLLIIFKDNKFVLRKFTLNDFHLETTFKIVDQMYHSSPCIWSTKISSMWLYPSVKRERLYSLHNKARFYTFQDRAKANQVVHIDKILITRKLTIV